MSAMSLRAHYDVVVLGAGPAGCTAAAALARQSLSVLIVEPQNALSFKVGESVPGAVHSALARAGYTGVLLRVAQLKCSSNRSLWGTDQLQSRAGILDPHGPGVHLDRASFDQELLKESMSAGAQLFRGARFDHATRSRRWTVSLGSASATFALECDAIIDCSGRNAYFARKLGIERIVLDKQIAVVAVLSGEDVVDNDLTTTIEAARDGWWYTARIPGQRRVAVFFTDGSLLHDLRLRTSGGFVQMMRQSDHVRKFFDCGYENLENPFVCQADTSYLTCSAGDGWCAAGDAAIALDPLASAGIVNAVNGGVAAARLVLAGFTDSEDFTRANIEHARKDAAVRQSYYLMEKRWPSAPFWKLRHRPPAS